MGEEKAKIAGVQDSGSVGARPKVVSTFAGVGGSSLGYRLAGFEELLAVDHNEAAQESFKLNFPDVTYWGRDIREVTAEDILKQCSLKKGELDILDGSPPCQGFSMSGKRQVGDERNSLFKDYLRLVDGTSPRVLVMENVGGMAAGDMRGVFNSILSACREIGYDIRCRLMNAANYGVPQVRKRLIFIGVRRDVGKPPSFPKHAAGRPITALEALRNLPPDHCTTMTSNVRRMWDACKPGKSFSTVSGSGSYFNSCKVSPFRPCPTVITTQGLYHWKHPRLLTISEIKRVMSFPDGFALVAGSRARQWKMLGNAVPPLLMRAVAEHIKATVLNDR